MRKVAVWKGSLSLGLINIPVEIYSVMQTTKTTFTLLHDSCHAPIHEVRICSVCEKKVEWQHVVKGIRLSDDKFFIITKENIKKLRPAKSDTLNLIEFVGVDQIDPLYLAQSYYLLPSKMTDKAFFLLSTVLEDIKKVAIGEFVLREKQHICMIRPYNGLLLLTLLHYDYEIRKINSTTLKKPALSKDEKALAQHLITMLSVQKFDISQFKDSFTQELKKQIERSLKSNKKPLKKIPAGKPARTKKDTLMESLQRSINVKQNKPTLSKNIKKK